MSLFSSRDGRIAAIQGLGSANDIWSRIYGTSQGALGSQLAEIGAAEPRQVGALQGGMDAARAAYARGRAGYDPYLPGAYTSWSQMLDAAGVNGQEGAGRARGAFQASPGYQYQVDQALDQTNRAAAASGQLASGNTLTALQDRASNLANQEYGGYYDRLQGIADRGRSAVDAQAGLDTSLGGLEAGAGSELANVYGSNAAARAGAYGNAATLQAGALGNLGSQQIDAYNQMAKAKQQAETNKLNLGIASLNALATIGARAVPGRAA